MVMYYDAKSVFKILYSYAKLKKILKAKVKAEISRAWDAILGVAA